MANISNLSRLFASRQNIIRAEQKAAEALQKARAARSKYERSVAESLLKSLFDMGLKIEDMPFILGAVLEARSRNNASYFIQLGSEYMKRDGSMPTASTESAASEKEETLGNHQNPDF